MRMVRKCYALAALVAVSMGAVVVVAEAPASASGATVTQISTVTLSSGATVVDVGTINSQFSSITVDASGVTTWCNDNPNPPCTSTPDGAQYYGFTLGPLAPLPGVTVGTLIAKIGVNGSWFVIGSHFTATSAVVADLYVAYDDDIYWDNTGSYSLTVTRVKPAV